ncbi:MAG: TatD family hydrolase [Sulfolobales archaeon]|nr:TatD family hydrolase [Sulfolobales archaeon]MCX8186081.1 TatD family hydrolase [Sulfolobales archaeon]MDW7969376.1 TatD family hydrolase [Sulfolobales archaeon]
MYLVDAHCHLHEFNDMEVLNYCGNPSLGILAVSDNYTSSLETLKISSKCLNVVPSVGIHPWNVGKVNLGEVEAVLESARNVRFLGEVGIDKRFVPESYEKQVEVLRRFLEYASTNGLGVNLHAAGAWSDALKMLFKYDVKVAIIHWYTGPPELLNDIHSVGYYITVNPAVSLQPKLRDIVSKASLDMILTESDGPYVYRGIRMTPEKVLDVVHEISLIKGVEAQEVFSTILRNYRDALRAVGL